MPLRKVRPLEMRMEEAKNRVDRLETQMKIRELRAKMSRRRVTRKRV